MNKQNLKNKVFESKKYTIFMELNNLLSSFCKVTKRNLMKLSNEATT